MSEQSDPPIEIAFGPVPSRRLGRSLGINNIPPKFCSYSCLYCQVGRTERREIEPRPFYSTEEILLAVEAKLEAAKRAGAQVDYLTFVPDGEPTLDIHLGETIDALRRFGIPVAVISNGSLACNPKVRERLAKADWVSLKVDTVDEALWRTLNRPHPELDLAAIRQGMTDFAETFSGRLATETMLADGINDGAKALAATADFIAGLEPDCAYLAVPIRPTAESGIRAPSEASVVRAFEIFSTRLKTVECLTGYEGNLFPCTGDAAADLLSITAVHPMREEAVRALLESAGKDWEVISTLIAEGQLKAVDFAGKRFFVRRLPASGH